MCVAYIGDWFTVASIDGMNLFERFSVVGEYTLITEGTTEERLGGGFLAGGDMEDIMTFIVVVTRGGCGCRCKVCHDCPIGYSG